MEKAALKAAKKMAKKGGSYTLKGKVLLKKIAKKVGDACTLNEIKNWLAKSEHFTLDGKMVTFKMSSSDIDNHTSASDSNTMGGHDALVQTSKSPSTIKRDAQTCTMNIDSVKKWRQEHKIVLKATASNQNEDESATLDSVLNGSQVYFPYTSFDSLRQSGEVSDILLRQCTEINGFVRPSPIQAQCWPVLLHTGADGKQRDVIGIAETGSGKTLAFGLPALMALSKNLGKGKRNPRMLVLAPTRELAIQSDKVLNEFGTLLSLETVVVYGGVSKTEQKDALRKGVDCVVATPVRIL
jgi:hypothetical protein